MTREELQQKLQFIQDEQITKHLSVFVTTQTTGLQLFNIEANDIDDLLKMFVDSIKQKLIDDDQYSIVDYSTTVLRDNVIYRYDLPENKTKEMNRMSEVLDIQAPERFNADETPIESITGIYVVIRDEMNQNIVLYKYITAVDKTYARSSFLIFKDNDMFKRQKENLLRISPVIHMIMAENEILLLDMKKLESALGLKDILVREADRDIQSVVDKRLVTDNQFLKKACEKTSMCKKLRHALTKSKVILKGIENKDIIKFAESKQEKFKFHFNAAKDAFDIKSRAEAERFIKLLDDDFLHSELSHEDYDSYDKESLK